MRCLGVTEHISENNKYAVIINYSNQQQKLEINLQQGHKIGKTLYGSQTNIPACDAVVLELL
jgi:hypothetical protein